MKILLFWASLFVLMNECYNFQVRMPIVSDSPDIKAAV